MLAFVMRLDDATPKMNPQGWERTEELLDKYEIKPIVGIIPDSKDGIFVWEEDPDFWKVTVGRWQSKGWTIAQHGCHHIYHDCGNGKHSEFIGLNYSEQMALIQRGNQIMKQKGVNPVCFFAPGHSFDETTVDVCRDSGLFEFISDGHAVYPFAERDMLFIPNIFDTAHRILPFGVYTFVLHPSFLTEEDFRYLEQFFKKNQKFFIPVPTILEKVDLTRKRNILEKAIGPTIRLARKVRNQFR